MRYWIVPAVLVLLASCKPNTQPVPQASPSTKPTQSDPTAAVAGAKNISEHTDTYEFDYSYPAQVAAIPALKAMLDKDLTEQRAELAKSAKDGKAEAKGGDFPFNPYSTSVDHKVVTDLPGWLSLSVALSSYSGGAHGNYGTESLLWDKAANQKRDPLDLFISKAAFTAALQPQFCDLLDRERAKRREEPVTRSKEWPNDCLDPAKETVLLGSSNHVHFNRIGILMAPYEAGSYAEGEYEVTLPVTAKLLAAVKPKYRAQFAVK